MLLSESVHDFWWDNHGPIWPASRGQFGSEVQIRKSMVCCSRSDPCVCNWELTTNSIRLFPRFLFSKTWKVLTLWISFSSLWPNTWLCIYSASPPFIPLCEAKEKDKKKRGRKATGFIPPVGATASLITETGAPPLASEVPQGSPSLLSPEDCLQGVKKCRKEQQQK